ncbi:hypothetical protein F4776DRAFT_667287 [Hypoxylon sp. NC0597]|nr:hypothetical protein F4776DRAFT_667287 [Hypoxylon sp. NC0597]
MSDLERVRGLHEGRLGEIDQLLLELASMKLSINRKMNEGDNTYSEELERMEKLVTSLEAEKSDINLEVKDIDEEIEKLEAGEKEKKEKEEKEKEEKEKEEKEKEEKEREERERAEKEEGNEGA